MLVGVWNHIPGLECVGGGGAESFPVSSAKCLGFCALPALLSDKDQPCFSPGQNSYKHLVAFPLAFDCHQL